MDGKGRDPIVKTVSRSDSSVTIGGSSRIPMVAEDARLFPVTELDGQAPESSFVFSPPPEAKLVASFPNPFMRGPLVPPSPSASEPRKSA